MTSQGTAHRPASLRATIAVRSLQVLTAALLILAVVVAAHNQFDTMRRAGIVMVAVLAMLCLLAQLPIRFGAVASGPAARVVRAAMVAVVAADTLAIVNGLRVVPPITGDLGPRTGTATAILVVSTVLLSAYLVAVVRATSSRAAVTARALTAAGIAGVSGVALWFCVTLMEPQLAASVVPVVALMLVAGGIAAAQAGQAGEDGDGIAQGAAAGLLTGVIIALPIVTLMDGVLPAMSRWVRNSAPPWAAAGPNVARLVDPIGLLIFGALVSVLATLVVRARKHDGAAG